MIVSMLTHISLSEHLFSNCSDFSRILGRLNASMEPILFEKATRPALALNLCLKHEMSRSIVCTKGSSHIKGLFVGERHMTFGNWDAISVQNLSSLVLMQVHCSEG